MFAIPDRLKAAASLSGFLFLLLVATGTSHAQLIETHRVFARETNQVFTSPLLNGVDYEFICRGTFSFWVDSNNDSVGLCDAAYYIDIPEGEFGNGLEPLPTTLTNGFLIDGRTVLSIIGNVGVSDSNVYVVPYRGAGSRVSLFIEDHPPFGVDRHADNTGHIDVEVRRVSPHVRVNVTEIDFGDVLLGAFRDSSAVFTNAARSTLSVTLSGLTGPNTSDFSTLGTTSFALFQNQSDSVTIRFIPSALGPRTAEVRFATNDPDQPEVLILLRGNGVAPALAVSRSVLDFGEVELGEFALDTVTVTNSGSAGLDITGVTINGSAAGDYSSTAPASFTLLPGDSRQIPVRFEPQIIDRRDAVLDIASNSPGNPVTSVSLTGVGVTTITAGFQGLYRGAPEDIVRIPIEIVENRQGSNTTSFFVRASYNYRILYPLRVVNTNSLSSSFNVAASSSAPGRLEITGTSGQPLSGIGPLVFIEFQVLFGDTTATQLAVDSLLFNNGNPRARAVDAVFVLDSVCNQRLKQVREAGVPRLGANFPNPFNPVTIIPFTLPRDMRVRLEVYDRLGRFVALLADGKFKKGNHRVAFHNQALGSGVYLYRLTSETGTITRFMTITR